MKKTARSWQEFLKENYSVIIADVEDFQKIKTLPAKINENIGLIENLKNTIGEYASILSDRNHKPKYPRVLKYPSVPQKTLPLNLVAGILQSIYHDNKTIDEISKIYELCYERVRDVHAKTIAAIIAGDVICENLILNKDIVDWVQFVKKECLYHPEEELINIAGKNDEEMFKVLGYDFVDVIDVKFVVPKGTKGLYSVVKDAVIAVLREAVNPIDELEFHERVANHKKMSKVKESFNQTFIDNILSCEKLIDSKDGKLF